MPVPLPPNTFPVGTTLHKAYDACLRFERRAGLDSGPRPSPLVYARLLGNMLLYAPVETGRNHIAGQIVACANDDYLKKLGEFYDHHLIRLFKSAKSPTPSPSLHPSRPSFDDVQEALKYELEVTPKNHSAAKAKALARDNYRCIVTGRYDYNSAVKFSSIAERAISEGTAAIDTQAAHIFPASTNKGVTADKGDPKTEYAALVWAVVDRFGGVNLTEELNGADIHRIENVMTLGVDVHSKFDRLNIWFEEMGIPNTYRVCGEKVALLGLPSTTTFTMTDPRLSLPDPRYLRVHAACAKIAHLSGAGEYIDRIIGDLEDTQVLAADGSSAHLLNYALMDRVQAVF